MKSPILIICYNRPKEFSKLINLVKKMKQRKIFIFQDGLKGKNKNWLKQRNLITNLKKNKNYTVKISDKNLGCKYGVKSAIDWFFKINKQGIILEDDCLPSISFFKYCDELLNIYKKNQKIKIISGYNFLNIKNYKYSYFFTKHVEVWGWATWKRVWKNFNFEKKNWIKDGQQVLNKRFKNNDELRKLYKSKFKLTFNNRIDTWDHQFVFFIWRSKGYTISPKLNLIHNIGFNRSATHTKKRNKKLEIKSNKLKFPIKHPKIVQEDLNLTQIMDTYLSKEIYKLNNRDNTLKNHVIRLIKKYKNLVS